MIDGLKLFTSEKIRKEIDAALEKHFNDLKPEMAKRITELETELFALREQLSKNEQICKWTCEGWYDDGGVWNTDCGENWQFTDGEGPAANRVKFCHHCGKKMVEVIPDDQYDPSYESLIPEEEEK